MFDKKLIDKYHLNEARKRFNQICEYTFITSPMLAEDDDEDDENLDKPDNVNANDSNKSDIENDDMKQINQENNSEMPNDVQNSMSNDETNEIPSDNMTDSDSEDMNIPNKDSNGEDDGIDTEEMDSDDEVIDVDDLTKSQESSEIKIDGVNDKLVQLLNVVTKFSKAIEQNDEKIQDLKNEFEKRNPTEEEQLNLRSQSSFPYSVKPKDYWDSKSDSNYNVIYNNDVPSNKEQEEFILRKGDLKGMNDRLISKSMDGKMKLENYIDF